MSFLPERVKNFLAFWVVDFTVLVILVLKLGLRPELDFSDWMSGSEVRMVVISSNSCFKLE